MDNQKKGIINKLKGIKIAEIFKNRRNVWIIASVGVVVIIAIILIIASLKGQTSTSGAYQTTAVTRGTLTSSVEGSGTVASIHTITLSWQTTGQVENVNVQIGDKVKADDVLASLLQSSLSSSIINAQADLIIDQRNLDAASNANSALAQAQLDLITAQNSFDSANSAYQRLLIQNRGASAADVQQAQSKLAIAQSNYDRAKSIYNKMGGNPDTNPLKAQAYLNLYNASNALKNAQDYLNYYTGKPSSVTINKAKATMEQAQIALEEAQAAFDRVQNGPDPSTVAIAQAKVDADQAIVNQAEIISPFDGTVTQVGVTPGDVISAGTKAFRIDDLGQMVVSVQVTEIDVNSVIAGQPATITFDAIPNKTYNGTVVQVDMAGTTSQNSTTFSALVELTDADSLVKPGMAANINIVTNRVENALLVPSTAIFTETTGQQYVYLINNGVTTPLQVTVGAVSDTSTQITSDNLKEGDMIVLSFASTSSNNGFGFGGFGGVRGGGETVIQSTP